MSEQQLVDCGWNWGEHGCRGGLPSKAFREIRDQGGIEAEWRYPYISTNKHGPYGRCSTQYSTVQYNTVQYLYRCAAWGPMAAQVGGHRNLPQYNEEALKSALYHHVGTSVACMYPPTLPPLHLSLAKVAIFL